MAYTNTWDEAAPAGSAAASDIDLFLRNLKKDIRERLETGLIVAMTADPVVLQNFPSSIMKRSDLGTVSGAVGLDLNTAFYFSLTQGGAATLSISNVPAGAFAIGLMLRIVNGGNFVFTWPAGFKWPGGTVPTLTTNGTDLVTAISDDAGVTWRAMVIGKDVK